MRWRSPCWVYLDEARPLRPSTPSSTKASRWSWRPHSRYRDYIVSVIARVVGPCVGTTGDGQTTAGRGRGEGSDIVAVSAPQGCATVSGYRADADGDHRLSVKEMEDYRDAIGASHKVVSKEVSVWIESSAKEKPS